MVHASKHKKQKNMVQIHVDPYEHTTRLLGLPKATAVTTAALAGLK